MHLMIGNITYPAALPLLSARIAWRLVQQDADAVDAPRASFAAAGLSCPDLPSRKQGEAILAYGDRIAAHLSESHPDLSDVELYNPCEQLAADLLRAMYPSKVEVNMAKNSSAAQEGPQISNSSTPGESSMGTRSLSTG